MALVSAGTLIAACTTSEKSSDDEGDGDGGSGASPVTAPASGPGPTTTDGPASTAATMMGGGICNSGLTSGSDGEDACLSASCCDAFNACVADTTCNGCLTNAMAPGCDASAELDAFNTCADTNCKTNVCDNGITFTDMNMDPAFACISCASDAGNACCTPLDTCVGDGSQAAVTDCLTCLNDPAVNSATPMLPADTTECYMLDAGVTAQAAVDFQQCLVDNCSTECGFM